MMKKQTMVSEWHIAQDDADWVRICTPLARDAAPAVQNQTWAKRFSWAIIASLFFLVSAGGGWWRTAQPELHQGEIATVPPNPSVRLASSDWGPLRSLETHSFVFHFRQNDAQSVIMVASQVESIYVVMRRNYGLPVTSAAKKGVIEVSMTQPPGSAAWFELIRWGSRVAQADSSDARHPKSTAHQAGPQNLHEAGFYTPGRFSVPSPKLYPAPASLTDAELLAQSIALELLARLRLEASAQHKMDLRWQPLLNGLFLWQLWDVPLPLAGWREEIVQWVYLDLPSTTDRQMALRLDHPEAICAAYTLWMQTPMEIHIPLLCPATDWRERRFASWSLRSPPLRLAQLTQPVLPEESPGLAGAYQEPHPGQAVALATVVEYAVAVYGRDHLPALVAGLGHHESWETLIPAVYGLSTAEFEAGWQAFLAEEYGVTLAVAAPRP
jgi:hypothetical protein